MTSVVKQFSKLRTRRTRRTWEPWDILSTRFLRLTLYISLSSRRLRFSIGFIFPRFLVICIISSFRCKKTERLFVVKVKSCFKVELHFFLPLSNVSFTFYSLFISHFHSGILNDKMKIFNFEWKIWNKTIRNEKFQAEDLEFLVAWTKNCNLKICDIFQNTPYRPLV